MVYYFTSTVVDPPAFVYVGKDKFESMEGIQLAYTRFPELPLTRSVL